MFYFQGDLVSRQSGKVTFPAQIRDNDSPVSDLSDDFDNKGNPFRMPPDMDIFTLRDREREKKKLERKRQKKLKVHEKTTYTTRINAKTSAMIRPADVFEEKECLEEDDGKAMTVKDDPDFTLSVTRGK